MKQFYLILIASLLSVQVVAQDLDVDLTDIDGNNHNIQNYLDQGKPVFIYGFSDDWSAWYGYEFFEIHELYNIHGQGGSNDVVVLMFASFGFENAVDLSGLDYSDELGPGYEDLSFTDDNPIPIILISDYPQLNMYEGAIFHAYCPQQEEFYMSSEDSGVDSYMNKVYTECCTTLETFDPALNHYNTGNSPDCSPTDINFWLSNESAFEITSCDVDVYVNGAWYEQLNLTDTLAGCDAEIIFYQNDALIPGDTVTFAIADDNDQLQNDTTSSHVEPVDTVRGHVRGEIILPQENFYYASISSGSSSEMINSESDFRYDMFYDEGCRSIGVGFIIEDWDMTDAHFRLTSLNEDGTVHKILADTIGDNFNWMYFQSFNLHVEESVPQQAWGYVYEDVNDDQTFNPDVPRIPGVQVNHDVYTTFTDADGYYVFPEITQGEPISIEYNEVAWPVYTTPNAGNLNSGNYIHNFGLLSDDPVWDLSAYFDAGVPYMCEWGISQGIHVSNSGNQPVSGTLEFIFDDQLTLTGTSPDPIDITGNTITWNVSELGYNQSANFTAQFDTVSADLLGNVFTASYNLTGFDVDDNVIANSSETLSDTLFCAYDPNDKYGFPLGSGPEGFIAANTPLKYRIRFQNTGNAPATNVTVVDTLPETLDWDSFVPGPSSHEYQVQMNAETREVQWIFNGINLPDSTSDPLGSIGHIWFDIDMAALNLGDQILNQAHIFFDQNEAITTNMSVHTIADIETGVAESEISFELYPNPARHTLLLKTAQSQGYDVVISDLSGRVLRQSALTATTTELQIADLRSGIYLVSVIDQSTGLRSTQRVVKL